MIELDEPGTEIGRAASALARAYGILSQRKEYQMICESMRKESDPLGFAMRFVREMALDTSDVTPSQENGGFLETAHGFLSVLCGRINGKGAAMSEAERYAVLAEDSLGAFLHCLGVNEAKRSKVRP